MKRLTLILLASLLVLGMAQCKKDKPEAEKVPITLIVGDNGKNDPGDGGEKGQINPNSSTALVTYTNGDIIYVGSNGKYVGYLTYQSSSSSFSGDIDASAVEGKPLKFIYMGGQDVTESLTTGSSSPYEFSLANQSTAPAVVSCGTSVEDYAGEGTYNAFMINQSALVKFTVSGESTDQPIIIKGVRNKLIIRFDGTVETSNNIGTITTYGTGNTRLAVVSPNQDAVTDGQLYSQGYRGTFSIPKAAIVNGYIQNATMTLAPDQSGYYFTVDDNDTKVVFSSGNLQARWNGDGWTWRFATNQWDYVGNIKGNTIITDYIPFIDQTEISDATDRIVDLFAYSSSGTYYGIYNRSVLNPYQGDFIDWGVEADAACLDNYSGGWRTLTKDEWDYLINNENRGDKRFLKAAITVTGGTGLVSGLVPGLIIFPDFYTGSDLSTTYTFNNATTDYVSVTYGVNGDWPAMAEAGAVFLPAAGLRADLVSNEQMFEGVYYSGNNSESSLKGGYYWSSTPGEQVMYDLRFHNSVTSANYYTEKEQGCAVRLVHNFTDASTNVSNATAPVVTTSSATGITQTNATCGGTISSDGGAPITARGVCWNTTASLPTVINGCHTVDGTGTGSFTSLMRGMTSGTTYHVRAYAVNSAGLIGYGDVITVTTTSGGTSDHLFSVDGNNHQVYFAPGNLRYNNGTWSFAPHQYDCLDTWSTSGAIDLFNWGTWANGGKDPYSLSTNDDEFTMTSSRFKGSIIIDGVDYNWRALSAAQWTYLINRDNSSTYRQVTVNGVPTAPYGMGRVMGRKGLILLPDDWDGSVDGGFHYGVTGFQNVYTETTTVKWSEMEAAGVVFLPAAGQRDSGYTNVLPAEYHSGGSYWSSTTHGEDEAYMVDFSEQYWGRLISNSYGERSEGNAVRLVRGTEIPPTVITANVTNIGNTHAICGGDVTDDGGSDVTARGVCWSTNSNPNITDDHTTDGTGMGVFESTLSGLADGVTYYVRAYATNEAGTSYGEVKEFTTNVGDSHGAYSISPTRKVIFSPGNLWYDNGTWSFAPRQYDYVVDDWTVGGLIDKFYWCRWLGNRNPYEEWIFFETDNQDSFQGSISGYDDYTWFTLWESQWAYLVNPANQTNRRRVFVNNEAKAPCGLANVMGVDGLILLPDDWNGSVDPNFTYSIWADIQSGSMTYMSNVYTESTTVKWSDMEAAGVVFLPYGVGGYWTLTPYFVVGNSPYAQAYTYMFHTADGYDSGYIGEGLSSCFGNRRFVRLVRDAYNWKGKR